MKQYVIVMIGAVLIMQNYALDQTTSLADNRSKEDICKDLKLLYMQCLRETIGYKITEGYDCVQEQARYFCCLNSRWGTRGFNVAREMVGWEDVKQDKT